MVNIEFLVTLGVISVALALVRTLVAIEVLRGVRAKDAHD